MNRHETLKHLMQSGQPLRLPGAYDVLSAKLIEQAGYPVVYIGSYGTAASAFGWPDVGLLELNDLTELAGKVFRIGHIGDMNDVSLLGAIAGVEMALLDHGFDIKAGSGVGAAVEYYRSTAK